MNNLFSLIEKPEDNTQRYNKLVRDKIPLKIKLNGETPKYCTLSVEEFREAIKAKLLEEVNELLKAATKHEEFQYKGKFGWLSPTGEFVVSDWGEHEGSAFDILCEKGFEDEYDEWDGHEELRLARDFLCEVKGWVLIHNPGMDGGYIVTNIKPMTKKQKEFLYDYFMAVGNGMRASMYIED